MKLLEDWKNILKKAWSMRLILISGLLSGVELVLPMFSDVVPRGVFAGLSILVAIAAAYARVVTQKNLSNDPA